MGLVVLLTESLGEMKLECLAIILEIPLKGEWVSIFRILCKFHLCTLNFMMCHAIFNINGQYGLFPPFFYRKLPGYGPHELWNGPHEFQHGSYGRDGPNWYGQDGPHV